MIMKLTYLCISSYLWSPSVFNIVEFLFVQELILLVSRIYIALYLRINYFKEVVFVLLILLIPSLVIRQQRHYCSTSSGKLFYSRVTNKIFPLTIVYLLPDIIYFAALKNVLSNFNTISYAFFIYRWRHQLLTLDVNIGTTQCQFVKELMFFFLFLHIKYC